MASASLIKLKLSANLQTTITTNTSSTISFRKLEPSLALRRNMNIVARASRRNPKLHKRDKPPFNRGGDWINKKLDPSKPENWKLEPIVELLKEGAVGVIPTDTVYAIVCDMNNLSAVQRLRRIKKIETTKPLSILCHSFHQIDEYTMGFPCVPLNTFRLVRRCIPGPYTFILTASKNLPKYCVNYEPRNSRYDPRKSIGVRMPKDPVTQAILELMESPLISTSVKSPTEDEWILNPDVIADVYGKEGIDFIVDTGPREAEPSTVVNLTGSVPKVIRPGKGPILHWMHTEDDDPKRSNAGSSVPTAA